MELEEDTNRVQGDLKKAHEIISSEQKKDIQKKMDYKQLLQEDVINKKR